MSARRRGSVPAQALSIDLGVVAIEGLSMTAAQVKVFRHALQAELQRLAVHEPLARTLGSVHLAAERAPQVSVSASNPAERLGVDVGRSLWRVIGGVK